MTKENKNFLNIRNEELVLEGIKTRQRGQLKRSGVIDAAKEQADLDESLDIVDACATFMLEDDGEGNVHHKPGIRLTVAELGDSELKQVEVAVADIRNGDLLDGITEPRDGFSRVEAESVRSMLVGMQHAKDNGVLPNLNSNLADLNTENPRAIPMPTLASIR